MANDFLRDRIVRKLTALPDERLYQVLDFVEFLETKYAEEPAVAANVFQRFAEGVEDRLRAGRVSTSTIAETMNLMHRAIGVLNGVTAAGKSVASDIVDVASRAGAAAAGGTGGTGSASSAGGAGNSGPQASPPAGPPPASPPSTPSGDRPA
ncbi:MAG: hypothetical protein ACYC2G_01085 [Gemmatimonadaceae bacterium]